MPSVRRKRKQSGSPSSSNEESVSTVPSDVSPDAPTKMIKTSPYPSSSEHESNHHEAATSTDIAQVTDSPGSDGDSDIHRPSTPNQAESGKSNGHGQNEELQAHIDAIMTPQRELNKRKVGITQAEKDALIANLKLEVAERSRRLRARYKTQAQYLRDQIEWRIDHVPPRLRNMTMGELLAQHSNASSAAWDQTLGERAIAVLKEVHQISHGGIEGLEKLQEDKPSDKVLVVPKQRPIISTKEPQVDKPLPNLPTTKTITPNARPVSPIEPSSPTRRQVIPRPPSPLKATASLSRPTSPMKRSPKTATGMKAKFAAALKSYGGGGKKIEAPASPTKNITSMAPPSPVKPSTSTQLPSPQKFQVSGRPQSPIKSIALTSPIKPISTLQLFSPEKPKFEGRQSNDTDTTASSFKTTTTTTTATTTTTTASRIKAAAKRGVKATKSNGSLKENKTDDASAKVTKLTKGRPVKTATSKAKVTSLSDEATIAAPKRVLRSKK